MYNAGYPVIRPDIRKFIGYPALARNSSGYRISSITKSAGYLVFGPTLVGGNDFAYSVFVAHRVSPGGEIKERQTFMNINFKKGINTHLTHASELFL